MAVTIGIDPHKASHTAAALNEAEAVLGELRVRSGPAQLEQIVTWAAQWPDRTWAIEGAGGLGYLLAQQFLATGEQSQTCSQARGQSGLIRHLVDQ